MTIKGKKKTQCVILRVAYGDKPAKNLEGYLREEILHKSAKKERLRMTIIGFCVEILRKKAQEAGLRMTIRGV